jgi:hypothetical protein
VLTALVFESLIRGAIRWRFRRDKQNGRLAMRTLFVGANEERESQHETRWLSRQRGWGTT